MPHRRYPGRHGFTAARSSPSRRPAQSVRKSGLDRLLERGSTNVLTCARDNRSPAHRSSPRASNRAPTSIPPTIHHPPSHYPVCHFAPRWRTSQIGNGPEWPKMAHISRDRARGRSPRDEPDEGVRRCSARTASDNRKTCPPRDPLHNRHSRHGRPLHNRHSREGGNPGVEEDGFPSLRKRRSTARSTLRKRSHGRVSLRGNDGCAPVARVGHPMR